MKPDNTQDVIVVGASVAGLFAAYRLARAGVPVHVLESRPVLDAEPRTLIVTPAWLSMLDFDVEPAVVNHTRAFELISRGGSARVELGEPDIIIERASFIRLLAHRVQQAGGELLLGHRFEALGEADPFPLVRFCNGRGPEETPASTVIGADGVHSAVARDLTTTNGARRDPVSIWQARVPLPSDLPPHTVRCWFDRQTTPYFYWLIPESEHTGVLGLIADGEEEARGALDSFLAARGLEPLAYQSAPVAMYSPVARSRAALGSGRALLVGDAAGQVKVTTVGGVVTGMRGSAAAARSILRGTSYAAETRALRRELRAHTFLRSLLDTFTDADYDYLLRTLNAPARGVLRRYSRDQLRQAIWPLTLAQPRWLAHPRWAALGIRALVQTLTS